MATEATSETDTVALDPPDTIPSNLKYALLLWVPAGSSKPNYARLHRVVPGPRGTLRLAANSDAVDAKALRSMALSLTTAADQNVAVFVRASRVLFEREPLFVWWRPPQRTHVRFNCPELGGVVAGRVPLPGLVFAGCGSRLRIVAVKGTERPTDATETYAAPFFNHYEDAVVCNGSVDLTTVSVAAIDAVEAAYFGSSFTHPNQRAIQTLYRDGIHALWRDLLSGKLKKFPEASLPNYPGRAQRPGTVASFIKESFR
jgi:PRTRC genetic system protein B